MHGIGRIPDEVGHLILSEDGAVIASGGELENAEQMGATVMSLLSCTSKAQLWPGDSGDAFKKISITYTDHSYIICLSNKNIHIVKRKFIPHEPIKV
ncbi:ragulator complex protein LAMTOR4 [Procambarus clarkii]|uniref:ragulator complex protein LAMTOR4 n=1 Tax=Procambarus clarkii TaxID=6728 RepID=UPI001E677CC1|nr:ragulator complex protein LAMTOR4-like [Procambarus clarkii]XP_045610947.1 ragulator complex protein LAMTOR4-like [Procambarus clarkii]XP_045610948.1 ragulator complex protein LAMTOR4-like [Procambarus clarkii]